MCVCLWGSLLVCIRGGSFALEIGLLGLLLPLDLLLDFTLSLEDLDLPFSLLCLMLLKIMKFLNLLQVRMMSLVLRNLLYVAILAQGLRSSLKGLLLRSSSLNVETGDGWFTDAVLIVYNATNILFVIVINFVTHLLTLSGKHALTLKIHTTLFSPSMMFLFLG